MWNDQDCVVQACMTIYQKIHVKAIPITITLLMDFFFRKLQNIQLERTGHLSGSAGKTKWSHQKVRK